jgi:photosystem II stability/assembly factor-like uncharacterized protein
MVLAGLAAPRAIAQQIRPDLYQQLRWRMIGPFRGGRTRAVAGVPGEPNVFYMGAVNGGVWKSDNFGRTWTPIFDQQSSQSIGAIAIAPSDRNIIYVASGEGLARPDLSVGNGIYKSTDAGNTWTHLGLRDGQQIPAIVVDPRNPNSVFCAVLGHPYGPNEERGIFHSTDGGQTWTKILYKDENTGGSDIQIDPVNPDTLYASLWQMRLGPWEDGNEYNGPNGGLFKSTDGGKSWKQLTNGLPKNLVQVYVAIAPSKPSRIYATVGTSTPGDYASGAGLGVYRSDDSGESWQQITEDPRPAMRIGGGDLPVPRVDPKNPDVVYSASIVTFRSDDGGKTWTGIRGAPGGDDYQNIWINPNNPNIILLVGDQGALVSVNHGETWSSWYNQPTAQLYHVGISNTFPYRVCSGQQESGSVCISSRGNDGMVTNRAWRPVGTIEYGYVAPDPLHPELVYGGGRSEVTRFHWDTGQVENVTPIPFRGEKYRTERTQPVMFSPVDGHILYYAANVLFKTTDGGQNWETISPDLTRERPGIPPNLGKAAENDAKAEKQRSAIYSLAPSLKTTDILWAGTDDGLIWTTRDGGKNWSNVTPPELTAWSKVTQISAAAFDDETAYASVSRFRINDLRPYIYRTHDGGKTWQKIILGLPDDSPVNTVRADPLRKGLLFAGTETAVWVSFDDGDHWQSLEQNLPRTSMRDLWIHDDDLILATHGRSFWILDDISPLRELTGALADSSAFLFKPARTYRVRRSTNTDTPVPPDEPMGENPPDGAVFDYYLKSGSTSPVSLEILDSKGAVVRRFSSSDKPELSEEELRKQLIPLYWIRPFQKLSSEAGMHRFVWDLRVPAPQSLAHEFPISAVPHDTPRYPVGPAVVPGMYTLKLSANGTSYSQPFEIKMDPRVPATAEELDRLFDLASKISTGMNSSFAQLQQARSVHSQLQALATKAPKGAGQDAVTSLDAQVMSFVDVATDKSAQPGQSDFTKSNTELGQLLGIVDRTDAAPTKAAENAYGERAKLLEDLSSRWKTVKTQVIPALNDQLKAAGLPEVNEEAPIAPPAETSGDDEP